MRLGHVLAHLRELESGLGESLRAAAGRHVDDHDVFHQCRTFAVTACDRATRLDALAQRYPGETEWNSGIAGESDDLLEEMRLLYLRTREVAITWQMVAQAAKAARDADALSCATESHAETDMQARWFETRIKTGAPQPLVVG
jgi:hypothetical protein